MPCPKLKELLRAEKLDLEEEIAKHKWYKSERYGFDVGWDFAEKDFMNNHLNAWAEGYKVCYCKHVCKECK